MLPAVHRPIAHILPQAPTASDPAPVEEEMVAMRGIRKCTSTFCGGSEWPLFVNRDFNAAGSGEGEERARKVDCMAHLMRSQYSR